MTDKQRKTLVKLFLIVGITAIVFVITTSPLWLFYIQNR